MKIDRRDRKKGKTIDLILRSSKTGHAILCADEKLKSCILATAKDLNVNIPAPVTILDTKRNDFHIKYSGKLLIDDVDLVLVRTFNVPIDVVTTSCEVFKKDNYITSMAAAISELVDRKNKDYNNSFDKSIDKRGTDVYFIRIEDKLSRLEHLLKSNEKLVVDESIEDTLSDIVGYTLLMMNYLNKKGGNKDAKWGF